MRCHRNQFIIQRVAGNLPAPETWTETVLGTWKIDSHPNLPIHPQSNQDGETIGVLLGWPLDRHWASENNDREIEELRESAIKGGGRYLFLDLRNGGVSTIPDPGASLSYFYDCEREVIVASNWLLDELFPSPSDRDTAYYEAAEYIAQDVGAHRSGSWFAGGLSFVKGFRIGYPNHEVALHSGSVTRFWPASEDTFPIIADGDLPKELDEIAIQLQNFVRTVQGWGNSVVTITMGRDSRICLAAYDPHLSGTHSGVTIKNDSETLDSRGAPTLAELSECPFQLISGAFMQEVGWEDRFCITGFGGELFRGFYHPDYRQIGGVPIDTESLMTILHYQKDTEDNRIFKEVEKWLNSVPKQLDDYSVLDLAYMELRHGVTVAQNLYLMDERYGCSLYPFNTRDFAHQAMRIAPTYKIPDRFGYDIVERLLPILNLLPYSWHEHIGFSKYRAFIRAHTQNANRKQLAKKALQNYLPTSSLVSMIAMDTRKILGKTRQYLNRKMTH